MNTSPLFKGATRPASVAGVPIKPFVINIGFFTILGLYVWVPLLVLCPLSHWYLKKLAEKDDQIFSQLFSYFQLNIMGNRNRRHWKNVTSYSPKQSKALVVIRKTE